MTVNFIHGNNGNGGTSLLEAKTSIDTIWGYACSGENENLKAYYENGGENNRRYYKFGSYHSLIAGAYRNGNFETVKLLLENGETVLDDERGEIDLNKIFLSDFIKAAENVVDYFKYHNKNLTKAQEYQLYDLEDALRKIT